MRAFLEPFPMSTNRGAMAPLPSDAPIAVVLAAGASKAVAVPADARFVGFSFTGDVWARFGAAGVSAAVPAADVADGTAPVLNPDARRIPDGATHVALVADAACRGSLEFWS
jgi:hypothetical protein